MRGDQHRHARLLQPADHLQQFEGGVRIEARGRLVEDGDLGLLHYDLGDAQPLAHAAREGRHPLVEHVGQADALHRVGDALLGLAARDGQQARGVAQVLARRQMVVEAHRIGQVADAALDLERLAHRIEAQHVDRAAARLGEAQQHQDGRRLAGAVRPQQAEDLAAPDVEIDGIDRAGRAIALHQPADFNDVVGHRGRSTGGRSARRHPAARAAPRR